MDTQLYNDLKAVISCRDVEEFTVLAKAFIKKYEEVASDFVDYFVKHYMTRPTKWAMCHRNFYHANIETTGSVESFHNRLKKRYMKRRPNKRVDDLINMLLLIEEDDFITRKREKIFGFAGGSYEAVLMRHKRGMEMADDCIEECLPNLTYEVKSSSDKSKIKYHIACHNLKCSEPNCLSICKESQCAGLCAHLFTCSCPDKSPLCKHVHKLFSYLSAKGAIDTNENTANNAENCSESEQVQFFSLHEEIESNSRSRNQENVLQELKDNFNKLNHMLEAEMFSTNLAIHANVVLSELIKRVEAISSVSAENPVMMQMKPTIQFSSREKLRTQESQMLPFKRAKKREKAANAFNSKLSPNSKQNVKRNLLAVLSDSDYSDDPNGEDITKNNEPENSLMFEQFSDSSVYGVNNATSSVYCPFTPYLQYVKKCKDSILKVGDDKLSIVHLKSLELDLSTEEEQCCKKTFSEFHKGQLMPIIIDAFLFKFTQSFPEACAVSSRIGAILCGDQSIGQTTMAELVESAVSSSCKIILFPANVSNHWVIITFLIHKAEVIYFDPMQLPIEGCSQKLLGNAMKVVQEIFPSSLKWTLKIMTHDKQKDEVSSGVHICFFAQQILTECSSFTPLNNNFEYRKFMYSTLVGDCLKRPVLENNHICLVCGETTDDFPALACIDCDQWFHITCVKTIDEPFFCPPLS